MKLSFSQIEDKAQKDLEWYWNESISDLGIKSNWGLTESEAIFGAAVCRDYYTQRQMRAVSDRREIEKVLFSLSDRQIRTLYSIYGWLPIGKVPPLVRNAFAKYSPIVIHFYPDFAEKSNKDKKVFYLEQARLYYRDAILAFSNKQYELSKKRGLRKCK